MQASPWLRSALPVAVAGLASLGALLALREQPASDYGFDRIPGLLAPPPPPPAVPVRLFPRSADAPTAPTGGEAGGEPATATPPFAANPRPDLAVESAGPRRGLSRATVWVGTTRGVFKFKFYARSAPRTTARILELIAARFYDGLVFHRVDRDPVPFLVETGDPRGDGTGGSGERLAPEFSAAPHVLGTMGMSRSALDPGSADSRFYISLGAHPQLDGQYTVFGKVVEGTDVLARLRVGDRMLWLVTE